MRLDEEIDQKSVMQSLLDQGISTRRGIMCAHREPAYATEPWRCGTFAGLPESERAQEQCIILPLFHELRDEDQIRVARGLRDGILAARAMESVPHLATTA